LKKKIVGIPQGNRIIKIPANELRIGMYVILDSWLNHPFLKNQFVVESNNQINQIREYGFDYVKIDPSRSLTCEVSKTAETTDTELPSGWRPEDLVPLEFRRIIKDGNMEPGEKADAVKKFSLNMMKRLIETPTSENISEVKSVVYDIVDMILDEQETANHLVKITDHDTYTYTHSCNVGLISIMLAKSMLDKATHNIKELGAGFFLHDLGKVQVDPGIINKPGKLTEEEMTQMRMHPVFGYQVLKKANQLSGESGHIVLQHHERIDGKGYPQGLARDEIHIYARICAIADVYDALTSKRSYKKGLTPFEALMVMRDEMQGQIQKDIFEHFVYMLHGSIKV